jgi:hypothetical protein
MSKWKQVACSVAGAVYLDLPYILLSVWRRAEFILNRRLLYTVTPVAAGGVKIHVARRTINHLPPLAFYLTVLLFVAYGPTLDSLGSILGAGGMALAWCIFGGAFIGSAVGLLVLHTLYGRMRASTCLPKAPGPRTMALRRVVYIALLLPIVINSAQASPGVAVYVAYADTQNVNCPNVDPPPFMPNPWLGSPNTTLLGYSGPAWNTGAMLIFNAGPSSVSLQSATVVIGASSYPLWTSLIGSGVSVPAGGKLILAQTTANSNFNTSGISIGSVPQVQLTIDGVSSTYADTGLILTTGGTSLANQTPSMNESLQWRLIGTSGVDLPGGTGVDPPQVLTWHNDNARTGQNPSETSLRPNNVNAAFFGQIGAYYGLDSPVNTQPLFVPNLLINGTNHNVVIVETANNSIYAFDAEMSNVFPPVPPLIYFPGSTSSGSKALGTPVIDPSATTLYFVSSYVAGSARPVYSLHALDLTTGMERSNSPQTINASVPGTGEEQCPSQRPNSPKSVCFNAGNQSQSAALLLSNGIVYVAFADGGDAAPYHGWVFGYDTANLANPPFVFNTTPNATSISNQQGQPGQTSTSETITPGVLPVSCVAGYGSPTGQRLAGGGIWMFGAGPAADANGIFLTSGNGDFNSSAAEYGDSILRLVPSAQQPLADYFTPYDQDYLNCFDYDFGSSGPVLLQDKATGYLVQATKPGRIYLINESNMGKNSPNCTTAGPPCEQVVEALNFALGPPGQHSNGEFVYGSPAYFNSTVFYKANNDNLKGFKVQTPPVTTQPSLQPVPMQANTPAPPTGNSATPSISFDSTTANTGIVWLVEPAPGGTPDSQLEAYEATTLRQLYSLWTGASVYQFAVPTVVDGKVFVGGGEVAGPVSANPQGILVVFGNRAIPTPPGTLTVTKTLVPASNTGRFDLLVNGVTRASGVGNEGATPTLTMQAGHYTVSERANMGTIARSYTTVFGGDCDSRGNICVTPASSATCTIRNTANSCPDGLMWCANTHGLYGCRPGPSCSISKPGPCPNGTAYCETQIGSKRVYACAQPHDCIPR